MGLCILCSNDIGVGEVVTLRQKRADSKNKASKERWDDLNLALLYTNHEDLTIQLYNA